MISKACAIKEPYDANGLHVRKSESQKPGTSESHLSLLLAQLHLFVALGALESPPEATGAAETRVGSPEHIEAKEEMIRYCMA